MASTQYDHQEYDTSEDEEMAAFLCASHLAAGYAIPMTLKAVIELGVFDIISNAGPGNCQLSPAEIVSKIATSNPQAPVALDRMLRYLASSSILTCSVVAQGDQDGRVERRYGLAPVGKIFVSGKDGVSLAPFILMNQHKAHQESWQKLKYAVLDGVIPFKKVHGMTQFEYLKMDPKLSEMFNNGMSGASAIMLKDILRSYTGFQGIKKLVDVGGGNGRVLRMIVSKFPHIRGINFDLPHVVSDAPQIQGVEHIAGDMFDSIPSADAIVMKWILHDWSDEDCLKILKNCLKALPDSGKVIILEFIIPEAPEEDAMNQIMLYGDLYMLSCNDGKERTEKEFELLATKAGFSDFRIIPCAFGLPVIEFLK